jgi:aminoglycoside phosphotransferase (APT) family kinase protein
VGERSGPESTPAAEVEVDRALVVSLLHAQHPDLAVGPVRLVANGWDNAIFRLGDDLCVRLPRRQVGADLVAHEQAWLPVLADRLPVRVPAPVRTGRPAAGYPWSWSVCPWFRGRTLAHAPLGDTTTLAADLAAFLRRLHQPAPPAAPVNWRRGRPLAGVAEAFAARLPSVQGLVDVDEVGDTFARLADSPPWAGPVLWLHGDLHPLNLLGHRGRLVAVLDWGDLTSGDPATDLAVAWFVLDRTGRDALRAALPAVDDATWRRARAWALHLGVAFLAHSRDAPRHEEVGRQVVAAALDDH